LESLLKNIRREIISVDFKVTDATLFSYSAFARHWGRKKWEYNATASHLFIDLKKTYDSE
jgi:hypothetical protein